MIETVRGGGIFQPAIDEAVKKLQDGEWVRHPRCIQRSSIIDKDLAQIHIFPEGRVNQEDLHPPGGLIRFKWGVSRIIMDSERMPVIIPIWISGFDEVMPNTRKYFRGFPRPGARISVTVGQPIEHKVIPMIKEWRRLWRRSAGDTQDAKGFGGKWGNVETSEDLPSSAEEKVEALKQLQPMRQMRQEAGLTDEAGRSEADLRIRICDVLYKELEQMGLQIEAEEGKDKRAWRNAKAKEVWRGGIH